MSKYFAIIPMLFLMACTTPETPAQAVFLAQSDYAVALRAEVAYSNLPRCSANKLVKLCSEVSVIKKLQKADNVAWAAIKQAQIAVRTPDFDQSKLVATVAVAKALTNSFVEITNELKVE